MESQGAPRAAADWSNARDSQDHGETSSRLSSFSGSRSSPQDSASFRSDIHDESYGYGSIEGTGDDRSVSSGGTTTKRRRGRAKGSLNKPKHGQATLQKPKAKTKA
eukprot:363181-Chlamydomonas_euryale.AAC.6